MATARRHVRALAVVAALLIVTASWFIWAVVLPLGETEPCAGVQLRSAIEPAKPVTPLPRPRIGEGALASALKSALRGQHETGFCHDFADPYVLLDHGSFYAYSTNSDGMHVPVLSAPNIFSRGSRHDALPKVASWSDPGDGRVWAPSVLARPNGFVMYYTTAADDDRQCVSRAEAAQPDGPFVDHTAAPMLCPPGGDAIDASPFIDADGQPYLVWKDSTVNGIVSQRLTTDGLGLVGAPSTLIVPDQPWEAGVVEGPSMARLGGSVFLFYSGNNWQTQDYAIGYAECASATGPCLKPTSDPWLQSSSSARGPGGEEVFFDGDGHPWLALHAWAGADVGYPQGARDLFVLQLGVVDDRPVAT